MASASKTNVKGCDRERWTVAALLTVALLAVVMASSACTGASPASATDEAGVASCPAAGTDFPVTKVVVGALTFDVRMAGPPTGEAVLLLHGFPQTSYEWRYQMQALADAGYRATRS